MSAVGDARKRHAETTDRYFIAPDGNGDPTLWANTDNPDRPEPLLRMREVGSARVWGLLVVGMLATNEAAS